ncbi:MAG: hypothetical protein EOP56_00490 [Sphingobacteriales bacterium]|nr:MAG: hypothetical protein EOP56_00490 [Sphingobacteriales bacterium]
MHNRLSGYKLALIGLLSLGFGSCERYNTYSNNNVIVKPFSLFVSDSSGLLYNSNDGTDYSMFWTKATDGVPTRAISTVGDNVVFVKNFAFVSTDQGQQFNNIDPTGLIQPAPAIFAMNQHMVIYPRGFGRIYMASNVAGGMMYSKDGTINTWAGDYNFAPGIPGGYTITSFTQLKNNELWAFDPVSKRLFMKKDAGTNWIEPTGAPIAVGGSTTFYLSHFANTLIIADYAGSGIWYSNNNGGSWTQYVGLPNSAYTCVYAPFEQTLLVGTFGGGVYRFDPSSNSFKPANNGLESGTIVRGITAKDRIYKAEEQNTPTNTSWIFLATNTGIYRSQNNGQDWFLAQRGNYTAIY